MTPSFCGCAAGAERYAAEFMQSETGGFVALTYDQWIMRRVFTTSLNA